MITRLVANVLNSSDVSNQLIEGVDFKEYISQGFETCIKNAGIDID